MQKNTNNRENEMEKYLCQLRYGVQLINDYGFTHDEVIKQIINEFGKENLVIKKKDLNIAEIWKKYNINEKNLEIINSRRYLLELAFNYMEENEKTAEEAIEYFKEYDFEKYRIGVAELEEYCINKNIK